MGTQSQIHSLVANLTASPSKILLESHKGFSIELIDAAFLPNHL